MLGKSRIDSLETLLADADHRERVVVHANGPADPSVTLGRTIRVNVDPLTVIGVSEKGFEGIDPGFSQHIRIPLMMRAEMTPGSKVLDDRRSRWVYVFGRLKPGLSVAQAQAGMQPLFKQILSMEVQAKEFAKASQYARNRFLAMTLEVMPAARGRGSLERQFSRPLVVLMSIVGLVLLVACSNVAGLPIARGSTRRKEIAIRLAVGASRARLIAQLLTESALLALFGGIAALGVSAAMARMLVAYLPSSYTPAHLETAPDWRILAFNFGVALATGCDRASASHAGDPDGLGAHAQGAGRVASRRRRAGPIAGAAGGRRSGSSRFCC